PLEGDATLVSALNAEWPLGANLDLHIQRARASARNWDSTVAALGWIHRSGFGTLPAPDAFPGLVQVYLDTQHDFREDRSYLFAALVVGPSGEAEVLEMADRPPRDESEAD